MSRNRRALLSMLGGLSALVGLAGCGGGSDGTFSKGSGATGADGTYKAGVFLPESTFAAKCASPRSGTDPFTHTAYPDVNGSSTDENNWLRSWTNDLYLWYNEVPDLDPSQYSTKNYFPLLMTSAITASGHPKDKFHFTYATSTWESLSQANTDVGYGAQFEVLQATPPRKVVIAFTEAGSPAAQAPASLAGGDTIRTIDGVDINTNDSAGIDKLNAGLSPEAAGETHTFTVMDLGAATTRSISLTAANVTSHSVPTVTTLSTSIGTVGYVVFNNHQGPAESELIAAVNTLKAANVTDLILDIRYNGGGYLDIASELAYMIAGPGPTGGQTFEQLQFNTKHPSTDPVTGNAITPTEFHSTAQGFSATKGQALPSLGLSRVFVLTTSATCSASESIINSLQGIGIQVIQIGSTTCGKPYGFYPADNCGTTYFSIQFRGVNARGFGDYTDGFTPSTGQASSTGMSAALPGCSVSDDFTHALGDQNESLLFSALSYRSSTSCGTPPAGLSAAPTVSAGGIGLKRMVRPGESWLIRSPLHEIRILRNPAGPQT